MTVSKRLRFEILRRDGNACRYCGRKAPEAPLTVDHVVPVALGGSDQPGNLVTACADCNSGKSSASPDASLIEDVTNDALRWSKAMEHAAEEHRATRSSDAEFVNQFIDETIRIFRSDEQRYEIPDPATITTRSLVTFRDCGLDMDDLLYAITKAMARGLPDHQSWKYFCGICWRLIEDRQERARKLIETEESADG